MSKKVVAESPLQRNSLASLDQKLAMAKRCSHGTYNLPRFSFSLPVTGF
jgi:hypothetical protein